MNSRPQKRSNRIWRRRKCKSCGSIFTTLESIDYAASLKVKNNDGQLIPFNRDKLFVSILKSCQHRPDPLTDASELTDTAIAQLIPNSVINGVITAKDINWATLLTLNRFDMVASIHYEALHKK